MAPRPSGSRTAWSRLGSSRQSQPTRTGSSGPRAAASRRRRSTVSIARRSAHHSEKYGDDTVRSSATTATPRQRQRATRRPTPTPRATSAHASGANTTDQSAVRSRGSGSAKATCASNAHATAIVNAKPGRRAASASRPLRSDFNARAAITANTAAISTRSPTRTNSTRSTGEPPVQRVSNHRPSGWSSPSKQRLSAAAPTPDAPK
jgi:hypothetical protein